MSWFRTYARSRGGFAATSLLLCLLAGHEASSAALRQQGNKCNGQTENPGQPETLSPIIKPKPPNPYWPYCRIRKREPQLLGSGRTG